MGWMVRCKGMPEFDGVKNFDRQQNGLVPVQSRDLGKVRIRKSRSDKRCRSQIFLAGW